MSQPSAVPAADQEPYSGRLPTFLIIGANKGGTTSLYHYLGSHPHVFMSPVKEPHFFSYHGDPPTTANLAESTRLLPPEAYALRTLDDYSRLFADARPDQTALGEASTGYLTGGRIPGRVKKVIPDGRFVAILRDPAERAWSEFLMMRRLDQEPTTTLLGILREREKNRYTTLGRYGAALDRWLVEFPREQLHIELFETFAADPARVVAEVLAFIGVDPAIGVDVTERHNARGSGEGRMDAETRAALVEIFRPDILRLQELLGRDLGAWLAVGPTGARGGRTAGVTHPSAPDDPHDAGVVPAPPSATPPAIPVTTDGTPSAAPPSLLGRVRAALSRIRR